MSTLSAQNVALEAIVALRPLLVKVARCDRDLENQIRRAANSMHLNIAEALGSLGGNTRARFHTALGSAREVRSGLQLAVAWGHVEPAAVAPVEVLLDRVCAMLWKLAGAKR
jgi:four helix bundle protein